MSENTDELFLLLENKELKTENEELKEKIKKLEHGMFLYPVNGVYMKKQFLDIRFLDEKLIKEFFGILHIPSKIYDDFLYSFKINRSIMQQIAFNISQRLWNDLFQSMQKIYPELTDQDKLYKKFEERVIEEKDYEGDRIWKRVCLQRPDGRGRPRKEEF
ncbi:hypothetical protein IJJ97_03670 [bacterium]|nr:hypothetical protein [bacterium]